ncbi:MYXO-CTERM domain-containing protein [Actinomadura rupiterrae]|nr:MYXO-CTERM domain-containing protein [Actinomadura rupiterrae]
MTGWFPDVTSPPPPGAPLQALIVLTAVLAVATLRRRR